MAVFSVNQVRQFYFVDLSHPVFVSNNGDGTFQFVVKNSEGKWISTDSIDPSTVEYVHLTDASAMATELKAVQVTFNNSAFTPVTTGSGASATTTFYTIPGQDYILRLNFRQYYGMSDEDIYQKYGAVHGYSTMTKAGFVKAMAYSLVKNFSREHVKAVDIYVNNTKVEKAKKAADGTITLLDAQGNTIGSSETLVIAEADYSQNWALGRKQLKRPQFEVIPTTVTVVNGDYVDEVQWGSAVEVAHPEKTTIPNSKMIADMEYFYLGYRGDQYRFKGWPNVIVSPDDYLVKPNSLEAQKGYDVLDIQFAYKGDNEDIQKSAKTMTFVRPHTDTTPYSGADYTGKAAGAEGSKADVSLTMFNSASVKTTLSNLGISTTKFKYIEGPDDSDSE